MVNKCCTSQKINGLQSSFGRGTINPEIHICNMFRPYSVSHSPSQWRYRQSSLLRMSRISHVLRGLASQVQRRLDLLCIAAAPVSDHVRSISGCSQRFWGFMRQDDHQYNIELVPKWEVCKVPSCPYASMCFPEAYYWKSGWEAICARSGVIFRIHHT